METGGSHGMVFLGSMLTSITLIPHEEAGAGIKMDHR
jgi:hypothetical protein